MKLFLLTLTICLLSILQMGCVSWPEHGKGGIAEHNLGSYLPINVNEPLTFKEGLRLDFELSRRQLDTLILRGAKSCFPASVVQAQERENRIGRELQGELFYDAANDVLIQREWLSRLERRLEYVLSESVCLPPEVNTKLLINNSSNGEKNTTQTINHKIYQLLNSDNQFATGSFMLNPKYVAHLAEAGVLLRDHKEFNISITGHTDFIGDKKQNQLLSQKRAEQVARYLQIMGIHSSRIITAAVADTLPLFDGDEQHIRLVNRRVSIDLIEVNLSNTNGVITGNPSLISHQAGD